jgi:hypothetical protein
MPPINKETAEKIWAILVEDGGAWNPPGLRGHFERDSFVRYVTKENGVEWRFQGRLGFGGKFYNNMGMWYVNCYAENKNAETTAIINRINEKLAILSSQQSNALGDMA